MFILVVTFEENTVVYSVDFFDTCAVDVIDEAVQKKIKVLPAWRSSIVEMVD